jgi:hypothetical protein
MSSMRKPPLITRFRKFESEFSEALRVAEYLLLRVLLFLGLIYGVYELVRQMFRR